MLVPTLVEFVGTFIFLSVVLSHGKALPIGIALMAVIYLGGAFSGGNFNPAISIMQFADGKRDATSTFMYIAAQVLGGLAALYFFRKVSVMNK